MSTRCVEVAVDDPSCDALFNVLTERQAQRILADDSKPRHLLIHRPFDRLSKVNFPVSGLVKISASLSVASGCRRKRGKDVADWHQSTTLAFAVILATGDVSRIVEVSRWEEYLTAVVHALDLLLGESQASSCVPLCLLLHRTTPTNRKHLADGCAQALLLPLVAKDEITSPRVRIAAWEVCGTSLLDVALRVEQLALYFCRSLDTKQRESGHEKRKQKKSEATDFRAIYRAMLSEIPGISEKRAAVIAGEIPSLWELMKGIEQQEGVALSKLRRCIGHGETAELGAALSERVVEAFTIPYVAERDCPILRGLMAQSGAMFDAFDCGRWAAWLRKERLRRICGDEDVDEDSDNSDNDTLAPSVATST